MFLFFSFVNVTVTKSTGSDVKMISMGVNYSKACILLIEVCFSSLAASIKIIALKYLS